MTSLLYSIFLFLFLRLRTFIKGRIGCAAQLVVTCCALSTYRYGSSAVVISSDGNKRSVQQRGIDPFTMSLSPLHVQARSLLSRGRRLRHSLGASRYFC